MKRILTIGGHDPSNGAGITADIQVMQHYQILAHSVCTALTQQSHTRFHAVNWRPDDEIISQLNFLLEEYSYDGLKISLIPSLELALQLITLFKQKQPDSPIIWDPILSASLGFEFHSELNQDLLASILSKISIWVPNCSEFERITQNLSEKLRSSLQLPHWKSQQEETEPVEWKLQDRVSSDIRNQPHIISCITSMQSEGIKFDGVFRGQQLIGMHQFQPTGTEKRGTGCRYGSVILAEYLLGASIEQAAQQAQKAIIQYRISAEHNEGLLFSTT